MRLLLAGLALLAASCAGPTPPTARPSEAAALTSQPSSAVPLMAVPTAPPSSDPLAAGMCEGSQLRAVVTSWEGNTGTPLARVTATNVSAASCDMRGMSEAQIVDGRGAVIGDAGAGAAAATTNDPAYAVASGASVETVVRWGNWCTTLPPAQEVTVAFVLPLGLGRFVASTSVAAPIPDCAMTAESPPVVSSDPWQPRRGS